MRRGFILLLLLLGGCGREASTPKEKPRQQPAAAADRQPSEAERRIGAEAADALRLYYRLIETGDYRSAYRMRTPGRVDADRFAANFAAYERYRAVVGTPSFPAEADGFTYIQLPVMITGNYRGGKPFGSGGNVMMRRQQSAAGRWQVVAN